MIKQLDEHVSWRRSDMADPDVWTVKLTDEHHSELAKALAVAKAVSSDVLELSKDDFPLDTLVDTLKSIDHELLHGRGFVRISKLDGDLYSDEDLALLYWGIGLHLGAPWPQNKHGHVLGDVIDQGKTLKDQESRGNELGAIALDFHTDGSDYVGLMCLHEAESGGLSLVANAVAIHNEMVEKRPDLAEALYEKLPWDFRGEQPKGGKPYYMRAPFTESDGRFFLFCVPYYIRMSQRHEEAPRLSETQLEALTMLEELARSEEMHVAMPLARGEMQFIYNYHVFHGRTSYVDKQDGHRRHLKRLWLSSPSLENRPEQFALQVEQHWLKKRSASRMEVAG